MLALYTRLIALRRGAPALEVGRFESVQSEGDVLAYVRRARGNEPSFLVALNLGGKPQSLAIAPRLAGHVALSTALDREGEAVSGTLALRADEGVVIRLAA
jgi:alpha-glucosidase